LASLSLKTMVVSSGVSIPEIGLMSPLLGLSGVPRIELNQAPAYPLGTSLENARSKAYLMSFVVTTRFTGGAYLMPGLMCTVIVLVSAETSGGPVARSGTGWTESVGLNEYSVRFVA